MSTIERLALSVTFVLSLAVVCAAQDGSPRQPPLSIEVTADQHRARFAARDGAQGLRLEVFAPSGEEVFDSGAVVGQSVEWDMRGRDGRRVPEGVYLATVSATDAAGSVHKRTEQVVVSGGAQAESTQALAPAPSPDAPTATGSGTVGKISKFTAATELGNSVMTENAGRIGVNISPTARLHVNAAAPAASAAANGTAAVPLLQTSGGQGGKTTAAGKKGGAGASISLLAGKGGDAVSGATNGDGGNITLQPGPAGTGGSGGKAGKVLIAPSGGGVLIAPGGGFVGIGTDAPTSKVTIKDSSLGSVLFVENDIPVTDPGAMAILGVGTGVIIGAEGRSYSGAGVNGVSTNGYGASGFSTYSVGVHGSGKTGVWGKGTSGPGVLATSSTGNGVDASSTGGHGVYGKSTNKDGVYGEAVGGSGVSGKATGAGTGVSGAGGTGKGVYGQSDSNSGVFGFSGTGDGVTGQSASGYAGNFLGKAKVAGNFEVGGAQSFGAATRQMLNLWNTSYGIGVQSGVQYFRTAGGFAWFKGGVHNNTQNNPGTGGAVLMRLDSNGSLFTAGAVNPVSDRGAKTNFAAVNPHSVLDKLAAVPIQTWSYKTDSGSARHIGPVAQDFKAAFNLGADDKTIATVDADGVALASIQALYQLMKEKDKQNEQLAGEVRELRAQLARQQSQLNQVRRAVRRKGVSRR